MSQTLSKALRYTVLVGLYIVPFIPLIVSRSMFFPFITGKNFTFRILIEVLLLAWLLLIIIDKRYRPRKSLLLYLMLALIVVLSIATIFGENSYRSFWSSYERMEGLIGYLHLFAYFLMIISVINTEKLWKTFWHISLGVATIVGIYGIFQVIGKARIHQSDTRIDATLGNATYMAVYMLFHAFLALYYLLKEKKYLGLKIIYGLLVVLFLAMLYFTATRGAILGAIGGLFLVVLLFSIFEKGKLRKISVGVIILFIVLGGIFFAVKNTNFVKESSVLSRFASISLTETTTESRFIIWGMAVEGFKEHPVLGWGPENFNLVFNKYYDPRLYRQEPWFDRAHNVFLDWLVTTGIIGLIAYLSLFVVALWYMWRSNKDKFSYTEKGVLTGLLAAYFFQNLFVFDNLVSHILFFAVLGFVLTKSRTTPEPGEKAVGFGKNIFYPASAVFLVLLIFGLYFFNIKPLAANLTLIQGMVQQPTIHENIEKFEKALSYGSFGSIEAREHFLQLATRAYDTQGIPEDIKQKLFNTGKAEMEKQLKILPTDARPFIMTGVFLKKYGFLDAALVMFEKAKEFSPQKQGILFDIAGIYLNKQEYDKAVEYARQAFESEPNYKEARIVYGVTLVYAGEDKLAEELLVPVYGTIAVPDNRFTQAFASRGQYDKLIEIWGQRVASDPANMQYRISLAASYVGDGQIEKGVEIIREVIKLSPEFKTQGEELIRQIRAGEI